MSTPSPASRPAEDERHMSMWDAIKVGPQKLIREQQGLYTEASPEIRSDELAPETKKQRLDRVFADCVNRLGPPPVPAPIRPIGGGEFYKAPCANPRERMGMGGVNRWCVCGYIMGAHLTGGAK